jgi:hypothetical protein
MGMTPRWLTALALAVVIVTAGLPLSAQRATKRIYVSALDSRGAPVLDLAGVRHRHDRQR